MYEEYEMADNAADVNNAENTVESTAEDGAAAVETGKDKYTETKAFSERLNKMTAAAVNDFIAGMGTVNPYTGSKVTTRAEYEEYRRMVEADERGSDPAAAVETFRLRSQLADYQAREEDNSLRNDPVLGRYYEQYRDELREVQRAEREDGNDIPLEMLLRAKLAADLPSILADNNNKAKEKAISEVRANANASPGSSGGVATGNEASYESMSDADFEKLVQKAMRGELRKS